MKVNFLKETLAILEKNNKNFYKDVVWIVSCDGKLKMSKEEFEIKSNINYDSGYGGIFISPDIVIVGDNWWLERSEYDGSEWWEFKSIPILQQKTKLMTLTN